MVRWKSLVREVPLLYQVDSFSNRSTFLQRIPAYKQEKLRSGRIQSRITNMVLFLSFPCSPIT